MKSFVRKVIFLGLVIVSITMVTSCKQEMETAVEEIQLTEQEAQIIEQYSEIGKGHNDAVKRVYANLSRSAVSLSEEEYIDFILEILSNDVFDFKTFYENGCFEVLTFGNLGGRSVESSSPVQYMLQTGLINTETYNFMNEIEILLSSSNQEYSYLIREITKIETKAMKVLNGDSLNIFMSYSETAKSSLEYWTKENPSRYAAPGLVAGADAAGAGVGVAFGIAACAIIPALIALTPAGEVAFIAACGVAVGAASSCQTYDRGVFTIYNPIVDCLKFLAGLNL